MDELNYRIRLAKISMDEAHTVWALHPESMGNGTRDVLERIRDTAERMLEKDAERKMVA